MIEKCTSVKMSIVSVITDNIKMLTRWASFPDHTWYWCIIWRNSSEPSDGQMDRWMDRCMRMIPWSSSIGGDNNNITAKIMSVHWMDMRQMNGHLAMLPCHLCSIISAYLTLLLRLLVPTDLANCHTRSMSISLQWAGKACTQVFIM